jgi:hypothetical protein
MTSPTQQNQNPNQQGSQNQKGSQAQAQGSQAQDQKGGAQKQARDDDMTNTGAQAKGSQSTGNADRDVQQGKDATKGQNN